MDYNQIKKDSPFEYKSLIFKYTYFESNQAPTDYEEWWHYECWLF